MNGTYDIIIVGAGPVGMFAAHEQQRTRVDGPRDIVNKAATGILAALGIIGNLKVDNYGH
ncbi:MAG: Ferredoxin--NADP reductase [Candidatus Methanocomedens sp.]|nr:MAG: Ferredoxin--NADP reductase [ANME-2 cluster archaeon]